MIKMPIICKQDMIIMFLGYHKVKSFFIFEKKFELFNNENTPRPYDVL